jgi:hypothetical protein
VFSGENWPVQTNGYPAAGRGGTSSFWNEQNALTASVFAGLKKLSFGSGIRSPPSTEVVKQIPRDAREV